MDFVDITDSAFSLDSSTSNDIMAATNDIISNPTNWISNISDGVTGVIPIPDDTFQDVVIPDSIHIDDDNSIFIYIGIGVLVIMIVVFVYNYYNKNKQVRFNETPEVCYTDSSSAYCRRSEF